MFLTPDEQAVLDAALGELAGGPLPFDELLERLLERGLTLEEDELDEVTLDEILVTTDATWTSEDGIVANVASLLDGSVFTHRITASELERGVVDFTPDLVVIDFDDEELRLHGGGVLTLRFPRDAEPEFDAHGSFTGSPGWLDRFQPGDIVAFRRVGQEMRLEAVGSVGDGDAESAALADAFELHAGPGEGIEPIFCIFDALCSDPGLFRTAVLPVGELLEAAGLRVDGAFVGRADEKFEPQGVLAERARRERIASMYAFDRCCETAFNDVAEAWSSWVLTPPGATPTVAPDVGAALAHGFVAPAFVEWVTRRPVGPSPMLHDFATALIDHSEDEGGAAALFVRASNAELGGRVLDAEADLALALQHDPEYHSAALHLSRYAGDRGDLAAAVDLLRRAGVRHDHPELQYLTGLLQRLNRTGRNEPCPCGSGRKFKACCLQSPKLPIEERAGWLFHKLALYAVDSSRYSHVIGLASGAVDPDAPDLTEQIRQMADDPFVIDLAVFENGCADGFLDERGILLPEDERAMLAEWCETTRRLWEITACDPGDTMTLRDTSTAESVVVSERTASRHRRPGEYLLARVVPAGAQQQLIGEPLLIGLRQRDETLRLLDSDPGADQFADWYGAMLAPPVLTTREGEPMELCRAVVRGDRETVRSALDTHYIHDDDQWLDTVELDGDRIIRAFLAFDDDGDLHVTAWSVARLMRVLDALRTAVPDLDTVEVVLDDEPEPLDPAAVDLTVDGPGAELVERMIREKEIAWLDESIPALDGLTPRQAADDPTRREDLVSLLREFDRMQARMPAGAAGFDASRLREALGLGE